MPRRRSHAVSLNHLNVFKHRKSGRWMVYYRPPGGIEIDGETKKSLCLYSAEERPSSAKIRELYDRHARGREPVPAPGEIVRHENGTWDAALDIYMDTPEYAALARPENYKPAIDFLRAKAGQLPMRSFKPYMIKDLMNAALKAGKPSYNTLLVIVRKAEAVGIERDWVTVNLTKKLKKRETVKEHRPWLPAEIAKWRAFYTDHASTPRLALELIYELGCRGRSDGTRLSWADITTRDHDGMLWIKYVQKKIKRFPKSAEVKRPIAWDNPDLLECLRHCPKDGPMVGLNGLSTAPFLRNPRTGEAFSPETFGYWWKKWAKAAGMAPDFLPHGARKILAGDSYDFEVAEADGRKLTGHSPDVFRQYGRNHDDELSAERAARKIAEGRAQRRVVG